MPLRTALLPLALFPTAALAQGGVSDPDAIGSEAPDEIVVSASRRPLPPEDIPQKVRLLTSEEVARQLAVSTNLFDIVGQKVPSLAPSRQKLSGFGESFRGREPLYLIDGVPQSNPLRNGSRDGFTLDPAVIERVEVLFGANALQGVGATGGVINYVTLSPSEEDRWQVRSEAMVTVADGVRGDGTGYRGAVTALRDFGAVDLVASVAGETRGAFYDGADRRIGVDGAQGDIQDSQTLNLFLKAGWEPDADTRVQLTVNTFELDGDGDYVAVTGDRAAGVPVVSVRGEVEGVAPRNAVDTYNLEVRREDVFGGTLTAQAFYREFEAVFGGGTFGGFFNTGDEAEGELTFDQSANRSDKTGARLTYAHDDLPVRGLTVTGGLDWLRDETSQALIQTGRLWVPETVFESVAPFVQLDQELLDGRIRLSGGARYEDASVSADDFTTIFSAGGVRVGGGEQAFGEWLPNVGGSFEAAPGVRAYASYAEGFTMPDVGRVLRGVNVPGQDVDTLLDLQPIVADNAEVGLSVDRDGLSANLSYFWSDSDFGQRLVPNDEGIFSVGRERTEIEGLEVSVDWTPRDGLRLGGGYADVEARFDADGDGAVDADLGGVNVAPDRLNLYAEAGPFGGASARVQTATFLDRSFDDPGDATDFDGYTVADLILSYDADGAGRFSLGVQNLTDTDYATYFAQAGTTSDARFFTGRGRTVSLRWTGAF